MCVLNNTINCHRVLGLKSFITLICVELKSKDPSQEEGHLNHCQEQTAHCTQLPLTIFHHWGLLHCRLSPNSLFPSVHVWHVESSSSEQLLASACECGLSGSQTPMPLHHRRLCSGSYLPVFRTIHGAQSHVRQGKVWAYNPRHVVILTVFMDQFRQLVLNHSYTLMSSWISFTVQFRDTKLLFHYHHRFVHLGIYISVFTNNGANSFGWLQRVWTGSQIIFLCWVYSCWQLNWSVDSKYIIAFRRRNCIHLGYRLSMDFGAQGSCCRLHAVVLFSFIRAFSKEWYIDESFASRWFWLCSFTDECPVFWKVDPHWSVFQRYLGQ